MNPWVLLLLQLLASLGVAVVTAVVTARIALNRFYSEKMWERKAEAYSKILEGVTHSLHYYQQMTKETEEGFEFSAEYKDALSEKMNEGRREVIKHTVMGAFIISESVAQLLSAMADEIEANDDRDWYTHVSGTHTILNRYLPKIRTAASQDLRLTKPANRGRNN